ncbi:outer membrane receptor protein involved in Fe transport [Runella defluvii]|uniref:Outer membrane receptor protein involved in Fe transport n=1 Tax=Runella defluvii TaxID=370973 RepID=A0A7W5ZRS1_9BACT|nr:outer membrane beta-barrel family protein [Runella defluvii]MBB3841959.1 outer membrane receptor protein involved in Fe transport [Runella defluvii]
MMQRTSLISLKCTLWFMFLLTIQAPLFAQYSAVNVSGVVKDNQTKAVIPFVNVILKNAQDSTFIAGTISGDDGRFTLAKIKPGKYTLQYSSIGYAPGQQSLFVGNLSEFIDLGSIELQTDTHTLNEVVVTGQADEIREKLDRKTFSVENNISQSGGSILQVMQNLPGVTVQEGKVMLRGSDKVAVLVDGKQTALTGFGSQTSLDNIPASAIDKIEIINNPSAKYDANGNAGIINIIFKKNKQDGFNGKAGMMAGLGALWMKKVNLPNIRPQFQNTPKLNPSLALNYRKKNINTFFQGDVLYTPTLNKNEFVTRTYDTGEVINQQTKRNRKTTISTLRAGMDWNIDPNNLFTISGLFSSEKILDDGDEPFFNQTLTERKRLWQFLEDELKTTITAASSFQHKFSQPGRLLNFGLNYTFHREDEKYFFTNIMPTFTGLDAFKLLSDEHVIDFTADYIRPLRYGRLEAGMKYRWRQIPTNMQFFPGQNSPLDVNAGGKATYKENIPALYGNYVYENTKVELEAGLRMEYVDVRYLVDPNHNTYKSDGYHYTQPFPNLRAAYKINDRNKLSLFFNRRVDRPNEVDIRVFPKYDDAEIIKVGNPALAPQFTNTLELGYKTNLAKGYLYMAAYHRMAKGTITRIASIVSGSTLIYSIMQNAGKSYNTGLELMWSQEMSKWFSFNLNLNGYRNQINAFSVVNKYPALNTFTAPTEQLLSGNVKWNGLFHFPKQIDLQMTAIYLAPDLIPQGKIGQRFSLDVGIKKSMQNGKREFYLNATDLLNTMRIKKTIQGAGFNYISTDYYETQVVRVGYNYKF